MVHLFHKKNKRQTARLRYKIVKKVSQHNKKLRRDKKKNPPKYKRKDPGVPNSLPFKDDILRDAAQRAKEIQEAKANKKKLQMEEKSLEDLVNKAQIATQSHSAASTSTEREASSNSRNFKSYYKELKTVVEAADVVLQVLDARDPQGSRCPQIEQMVISSGKKLVLVINKIDLIPRANLEDWLKYLRLELPTVAFKASTQVQSTNLSQSKVAAIHINEGLQESSRCVGASFLMKVLGNYCRNHDVKTSIVIGVVGFPNVGKSSVINSLKRSRSCTVGAVAGVTKSVQEVSLDKHIKILDSPGVVFAKDGSQTTLALRNAVKVEALKDVITPAEAIIQRADHAQLCLHYIVPDFSSSHELMGLLAKRMGKYKKGGIPNIEQGAKRLINDWNKGFIKYYTHPPETYTPSEHIPITIVSEFSKAFDISAMEEKMELDKAAELLPSKGVVVKSTALTEGLVPGEDEEEEMEEDEKKNVSVSFEKKSKKRRLSKDDVEGLRPDEQKNKTLKKKFKQMKRKKRKTEKTANALSDAMDSALTI